jgi:hypothetical protein
LLKLDHPHGWLYSQLCTNVLLSIQTDILSDGGDKSFLSFLWANEYCKMHHKTNFFKDTALLSIFLFPGNRFSAIEGVSVVVVRVFSSQARASVKLIARHMVVTHTGWFMAAIKLTWIQLLPSISLASGL